jgi:hypothetical protein
MPHEPSTISQYPWILAGPKPQIKKTGDDKEDKDGDPRDKATSDEIDCNNHIREELLKLMADLKGNNKTMHSLETVSIVATRATSPETAL